jgi:protein gp37
MRYQHPNGISWTDWSSNPIRARRKDNGKKGWACSMVSEGCSNCYASAINERFGTGLSYNLANLNQIEWWLDEREFRNWGKAKPGEKIFVGDMTDLFHEQLFNSFKGSKFLHRIFSEMEKHPEFTFQILTKRPELMARFCAVRYGLYGVVPKHIWLGTSVENKKVLNRVLVLNSKVPVSWEGVRFLSVEPLLEDISDLLDLSGIKWVIVGGESGPNRRLFYEEWARKIRDICMRDHIAFWFKQGSDRFPGKHVELDGRKWQNFPNELPEELFVR